jgi:CDP-diacylglycerol pyrophosphatase
MNVLGICQHKICKEVHAHMTPVRKVFKHFEYLENRSRSLDVTWQPLRGDLTAHP